MAKHHRAAAFAQRHTALRDIVSPFDDTSSNDTNVATASPPTSSSDDGPYELTWENVEKVLDEMRPYLIQDGGNVAITEIDGPVVRLELQVRTKCTRGILFTGVSEKNLWGQS